MASKTSSEKIILIDGSGYIFRAYFAIQRLSTSAGMATNAVFGFVNMLQKVIDVEKPTKLAIAFDMSKKTFRKERYPAYKANREKAPEDLTAQIPYIHRVVDGFGVHRLDLAGYEADDLLGTVARRAEKEGYQVEIITGDKDLMQLVTDRITLFDPMKDKRYDIAGVVEKFGVQPTQIVDFLALMGDTSDNIPGVSGIGEKTAADLIRTFGSLDGIYQRLGEIKQPKRRDTLVNEKELAYLSQELATVKCDVELDYQWRDLDYRGVQQDELRALFKELEFNNFLKRYGLDGSAPADEAPTVIAGSALSGEAPKTDAVDRSRYVIVRDAATLEGVLNKMRAASVVAVDTETTSLVVQNAVCVGISLCADPGEAYYIPVNHRLPGVDGERAEGQMSDEEAKALLKPFLEDPKILKVGQNLKYDLQVLRRWGIHLRGVSDDTLLESYLLDPDQPHNLDSLARRHLGHENLTYESVAGSGKAQVSFAEVAIERAAEYSAEDVDVTLRLHTKFRPELKSRELDPLYLNVELPLLEVLAEMEYCGVLVDADRLLTMSADLEKDLKLKEKKIYELAGEEFNINSPKQLSKILFEKLKLPVIKKTKTGISTDESVLQQLSSTHEICQWIVKYRELGKLRSTYVEGLLGEIHPDTHRVHTSYNQTVAATGRLSSSSPNLQNIPVDGVDYDIRAAFVAREGCQLLSADYSQIELRLLADMSGDPELVRAFENDEDVHEYTGRLIFGVDSVSSDQRRIAKTINFGVVYGQTPYGLSQTLRIAPRDAKEFIDKYFARYSGVQLFLRGLVEDARGRGYAMTRMGRRRYIPEISSSNRMRREMAERVAINAPLQGTAADLIKKAMVSLADRLKREKLKTRMILQVHDELVFEVPLDEKQIVEAMVREEMENAMKLRVPLKVDLGWGVNWRETSL